ncbi:tRNA 2-selenouridine synthase [Phaeobacter gallaeciensis]|uniref:tRNA 2-selenouridine synthase n=1 Tax=Phaeobacter gallaeciensis TaxID=60890 RepID=A0A1B0ZMS1_9RHOB|nr:MULTISPECIES: tRNA 2-selenouridine(34) synthase MnmH [Phaeobacter]MEE2635355.1 tRNA 2-selenouridine(34) synthase MnmH [Pseudomonadota bacterium]ANP35466.1 tRNA 2-selenouridine synthase [Phaeobacter gallaeciensis]MDE4061987.1 tRNA 2-selenouridine(34) synthase MnmH [Phaeobacter gallaeciensis]MDE4125066.1 tRNA 2-selenouridine(34) synthase MnmH [Phaeobacter gallaeciensis]MDE4129538.1 tRNA 2-selenouridine(34) synthase MnmH [Phaeobacter gallaeciensis]
MVKSFSSLQDMYDHGYDTIIDVRSPAEFAEDHVPGAINLPVLNNEERAEVGTIYVQESPFLARKLGAAMVFRNAARHIEETLSQYEGGWRPLVYCWRGGQRSGSFTYLLQQIGWRAEMISGGYQSYRRLVHQMLYEDDLPYRLVLLDGYTGTAKTDLLKHVAELGAQVLDLEGLANHRGSLLGGMPEDQPGQKAFESALAGALSRLDPSRPVLVEAESSKVGDRIIPPSLWSLMKQAPRIEVSASVEERCRYLLRSYSDGLPDADTLSEMLERLRARRSNAVVDGWLSLIEEGDMAGLARALMEQHYDPAYRSSRRNIGADAVAEVQLKDLDDQTLQSAATTICDTLEGLAAKGF